MPSQWKDNINDFKNENLMKANANNAMQLNEDNQASKNLVTVFFLLLLYVSFFILFLWSTQTFLNK